MLQDILKIVPRISFFAKFLSYVVGVDSLENSTVIQILAWIYAFQKAVSGNFRALTIALLSFPKFRLGLGRDDADKIPLIEHIIRFISFRKFDLKLAPGIPLWKLLATFSKYGPWQRHKIERELADYMKGPYRIYIPFQRFDWTKPTTLVNFLNDPEDVEQVLTDREAFPTRVSVLLLNPHENLN